MKPDQTTGYYAGHDGLQLFYRDFEPGRPGTPVICLPGLTRNSRDFEKLAVHLAKRRRVVTPDLRGRGFSAWDPEWRNYHPGTYVSDVWALLDSLAIGRVAVIGTSLGGLIAMLMAFQGRERLAGVIMNDIGPEIAPEGLARVMAYTGNLPPVSNWDEAITQTREVYGQSLPDLDAAGWEEVARRGYRANADGVPALDMDPNIGTAIREAGAVGGDPWLLFDALADTPTLVLHGALSDILSLEILARMHARKPDLQSVEIPNRGHVPLLDEPESLSAIDRFIDSLPA